MAGPSAGAAILVFRGSNIRDLAPARPAGTSARPGIDRPSGDAEASSTGRWFVGGNSTHSSFVHVTHDQEEAMAIADLVVIMNRGRIEDIGRPQRVYEKPRTRFSACFLREHRARGRGRSRRRRADRHRYGLRPHRGGKRA